MTRSALDMLGLGHGRLDGALDDIRCLPSKLIVSVSVIHMNFTICLLGLMDI